MISLDSAADAFHSVELEPFRFPVRPGVLLDRHPAPAGASGPTPGGSPGFNNQPGHGSGVTFVAAHPHPPEAKARTLAATSSARALVICPRLASPARAQLALVVARLLADQRHPAASSPPVITCGTRPTCAWESGTVILPHLVTVVTPDAIQMRVVWELTHHLHLPAWPEDLRPRRARPTAVVP
ncbi:hypothetical protein [Frankia nepalensis]|uniref:Uncharacterized protein n=2 Tax=Frankia nepalensis TaxID=1836974 RepID=A0A937RDI7_9ACTN|nr:hypothetical protein [Frankia nepalensis]MBL7498297.1 hypothetical protein [Frankia nepalensis]MBL7509111.1 hypothetical protein [Frankia nepalensis]MBL7630156.1 hypothetical protein [Frankia nepalensis]